MITRSSGFSLIELLVVVAIVGIISAVATIAYTGYISSAKASAAKNLMAQIALAQSEEYANSGSYFKTDSTAECRPSAPGTSDGEETIVNIEFALFDGAQTIPRDGNYGYCIGGDDANNFLVIAHEFSGGNHTGCILSIGRRGGVISSNEC